MVSGKLAWGYVPVHTPIPVHTYVHTYIHIHTYIHTYSTYIHAYIHTIHIQYIQSRVYRPAEGGERACNSRTSCIEGEMLAVTKFKEI